MTEEIVKIPEILRKLNVENSDELMMLFDVNWRAENTQEIELIEHQLKTLVIVLRATIKLLDNRPYRHIDEILNTLACIYLQLDKSVMYVKAMDKLVMKVLTRSLHGSVKPDEN